MKRSTKVYKYIKENSLSFSKNIPLEELGFSAQQIADDLNLLRNNVSKELNLLCRDGKVIKIKNRPVKYFDKDSFSKFFNIHTDNIDEIDNLKEFLLSNTGEIKELSPFDYLIGSHSSLKTQIEQAKAAIMYPPNGLHTLIIGNTGVGKSLFAKIMFDYAKYIEKINSDAPFIVFNCADYYTNPQLLLSHLFGHVKGAFTGADKDKEGIVEKANGGILFLDEIHRLPPEGQEMIFYFMDTGSYCRLGENTRTRKANVLIIAATTEDPSSTLLNTFIRRIPITISLPNFEERSIEEKIALIKHLFSKEAQRINKPITINPDVVQALIGSTTFGNVGQLKSNIQLVCAQGFLNSINKSDCINIEFKSLPKVVKSGIVSLGNKRSVFESNWHLFTSNLTIYPNDDVRFEESDTYDPPFNLYKIIEDKASMLKDDGLDNKFIEDFLVADINIHLKKFYSRFTNDTPNKEHLSKIVDSHIIEFSEEIKELAENKLNKHFSDKFIYAFSLHISSLLNMRNKKDKPPYHNIQSIITSNPDEYELAIEIHSLINERYNISIDKNEIIYLTLLLNSLKDASKIGQVSIIVAAHGVSTATSMVNVSKKLFECTNIVGIDMSLDTSPTETLTLIKEKVIELDNGKGVLLLVDMGSLNTFGDIIYEETKIRTRTIDMVSTPVVLEAIRKATLLDMDLDSIYNSLKDFRGYISDVVSIQNKSNDAIVTICSTGEGTALMLKEILYKILIKSKKTHIKIFPVGLFNLTENINELTKSYNIIATIGVKDPYINVPHISLDKLIGGNGEDELLNLLHFDNKNTDIVSQENIVVDTICKDSLNEYLTYLNPSKVTGLLNNFISILERDLNITIPNPQKIQLFIHTACVLERMVINEGLDYLDNKSICDTHKFKVLTTASKIFENTLSIKITKDELCYIYEIIS